MITHIAHMDQDQSTDRSGEYLVYGNAASTATPPMPPHSPPE